MKIEKHMNKKSRSGSVLMITVLTMALLLVLVLAFVAVVRLELRKTAAYHDHVLARANARLAIELAVANLQENIGPDRRVTGRSDMDSSAIQRHWTGVWRNPVSPIEDLNDPAWRRDDSRKAAPEFVTWLVSGDAPDGSAPNHRVAEPFGPENRQILLGRLPDPNAPSVALDIYGGRVFLERPGTAGMEGSFAYWVEDEGVKAMAGQSNPHFAGWDRLKAVMSSQRAGVEILDSGVANLFATAPTAALEAQRTGWLERVRKVAELIFLSGSPTQTASLRRILPHITMASYGVHADTLHGGLKRDLSLAFEADDGTFNAMVDFAAPKPGAGANAVPTQQGGGSELHYSLSGQVTRLNGSGQENRVKYIFFESVPDHPAAGIGTYTNSAGGGAIRGNTWHQLRDFYRTYKRVQNPAGDATLAVTAPPYSADMIYSHTSSGPSGSLMSQQSDNITQRNHFHRDVLPGQSTGWRPISRALGNPMVPVLARERWIHSFTVAQGSSNTEFVFSFALAPILTLWNPYNVALEMEGIEFEKHRFGTIFEPQLHSPREGDTLLGFGSFLVRVTLMVANQVGSILRDAYPGLADTSQTDPFDWSVLMRINRTGAPGGGSLRLEPGELRVFSVGPGSESVVDPEDNTRLLLYLKPFDLSGFGALQSGKGLVFTDAWRADIRNPYDPVTQSTEYTEHEGRLDRVRMADGSYNPEVAISVIANNDPTPRGGALDLSIRSGGGVHLVGRHYLRFSQGRAFGGGAVWNQKDIPDSYPLEGVWPRNFQSRSDFWRPARGHAVQDLFGVQHAFIMTNFFLKPENYQVLFNHNSGRSMGRFPVPVMSHFNSTAPIHWVMTGVKSPHPVSDIWDGSSTVIDGPAWTSVPPYPGAIGFEPEDEVVDPDGKGYWGRAYDTRSPEAASRVVMREAPVAPLLSVGAFRHANLSLYENQPMYTAGESFPSPYVAPDRVWETGPFIRQGQNGDRWTHSTMVNFRTLVDWTYLVNEALWDRYFFSGIAPDPFSSNSLQDALTNFIEQGAPLANSRIALIPGRGEMLREALDANTGEPTALSPALPARTTLNRGAFNINSTSVEAWMSILSSTLGVDVLQRENGSVALNGAYEVPFPRQTIPSSEPGEPNTWQKFQGLDSTQIEALATALVAEIRRRGPFTSLSDFVNRRLAPPGDPTALAGTIQAAIDAASGINTSAEFSHPDYMRDPLVPIREPRLPADFPYPQHLRGAVLRQSAVSYLTQGDILQVIGPALSARSDTFKIISYGDALDPVTGTVRARAYAEAVVQRFPDPVSPSAADPYEPDNPEQFGRRFRILSFNWLDKELEDSF